MATDIFISTHAPDAVWLDYSLRSVVKFARGFRQTVVIFPSRDAAVIDGVLDRFESLLKIKRVAAEETGDGHLHQNIHKTSCDLYSDADFFFNIDSDSVFTTISSPLDFSTGGKPDVYWAKYQELDEASKRGEDVPAGGPPWKEVVDFALGFPGEVETMRRPGLLYPRWLYSITRQTIERQHGVPFSEYVMTAQKRGKAFHAYCEFNTLGSVAYYVHPEWFNLIHYGPSNEKPWRIRQFWSGSLRGVGISPAEIAELEGITEGWDSGLKIKPVRTDGKILLCLQYWRGDQEVAMRNARRIADNEPEFCNKAEFLFVSRFDCVHDEETIKHVSKKFKVSSYTCSRQAVGWPAGCNAVWGDLMYDEAPKRIASGAWKDIKAVFTFEGDCVPVQIDWIEQLSAEWDAAARKNKFIVGCFMPPPLFGPIGHINGNAMFAPDTCFRVPSAWGCKSDGGWDALLAPFFQPHWYPTPLITNYYKDRNVVEKDIRRVAQDGRVPALVHGVKDFSVEQFADSVLRKCPSTDYTEPPPAESRVDFFPVGKSVCPEKGTSTQVGQPALKMNRRRSTKSKKAVLVGLVVA